MPEGVMQGLSLRPRPDSDAAQAVASPCGGSPGSPGVPAHLRVRTGLSRLSGAATSGGGAAAEGGGDGAAASPHGPSPRERNAFFSADPPPQPPPLDLDGGLGAQPPPPSTQPRRSGMRRSSLGGPDAPKPRAGVSFAASIEDVSVFTGSPKRAFSNPSAADAEAADAEDAAEAARQEQGAAA